MTIEGKYSNYELHDKKNYSIQKAFTEQLYGLGKYPWHQFCCVVKSSMKQYKPLWFFQTRIQLLQLNSPISCNVKQGVNFY